ncbi:MAG: hypothetical protein ACJA0S_000598 [Rickettsiales bacterium]|jgi:hypothetical protein
MTKKPRKIKKLIKPHKPKKHVFGKIISNFIKSFFLITLISAFYFLALIAIEYKSFSFITSAIEESANKNLPRDSYVKIKKSSLKFSSLHKIKVRIDDVRLISKNKKEILLPKVEAEFSIFNLIFLKTTPSKLTIISPEIEINDNRQISFENVGDQQFLLQEGYSEILSQIFTSLKSGKVAIKNFSITNAKINVRNGKEVKKIILKDSQISTSFEDGYLKLVLANRISLNPKDLNLLIDANCGFKKNEGLECDINFRNLILSSIVSIDPKFSSLKNISGKFSGNANLIIDKNKHLSVVSFDLLAKSASFYYPELFSGPIDLKNLIVSGKLDNIMRTFSIDNLHCNFDETEFAMSLLASDFLDNNLQKTIMQFKVSDVPTGRLKLLWPTFLNQKKIRDWFLNHIKNGTINDAYATMILENENGAHLLQKIESEVSFSELDLNYDHNFPPILKTSGIASFNKNSMQIDISKGDVLNSKIRFASIVIPEFGTKNPMLNIDGKITGNAEDTLKHISYKSAFSKEIYQYFKGNSQTSLSIKLPIKNNLSLQDTYIKVSSDIDNFENEYISNSNLKVSTFKNFARTDFVTKIDLTGSDIDMKKFNITKKIGVKSIIKTSISFDKDSNLHLKEFDWQEENKKMTGDLSLKTNSMKISKINMENHNFADSNFDLVYKISDDSRFLRLNGSRLNLESFLEKGVGGSGGIGSHVKNDIKIDIDKLNLAKNQNLSEVEISLNCDKNVCEDGIIFARVNNETNIDIEISSPVRKKPTQVRGFIEDVSVIAKGFNISNQILDGRAKIKSKLDESGLGGEIKISRKFTILKNEVVDKIYGDESLSKFKEKDLQNNKIELRNLKLKFVFKDNILNIKTLITNSYTLGFTAKGEIDIKNGTTNLKGLIVPGYALNKFFGIGRIPILGQIIVGEEGGGIFSVRYSYVKKKNQAHGDFKINKTSAIVPGGIRNIFNLF